MTHIVKDVDSFHSLHHTRFPWLLSFTVNQTFGLNAVSGQSLSIVLTSNFDISEKLVLTFAGVVDLVIDWPKWSVVRLDVIEIVDIRARGMEELHYRVSEGAGMFAFSCREFEASVK